jgi:signal transduction histidine kinase
MSLFFRDFILGKDHYIGSHSEYKRAMLLGQLTVISIIIPVIYMFIDLSISGFDAPVIQYLLAIAVSLFTLWLIRQGKVIAGIITQLVMANALVFYFAFISTNISANYLFFIANAIGGFALFGYRYRYMALVFVALSVTLFFISYGGYLLQPKNGSIYVMINFCFVVLASVLAIYFLLNLNHHSERLATEKNDQLLKVNAELDRFVYSASHDLRAPLSSLLGLIEISSRAKTLEEINTYLAMMRARVQQLDEFIGEIIDYSRNARLDPVLQPIALATLVDEAMDALRFMEGAGRMKFINEVPAAMLVKTDPARLRVVLNNLLNNSVKYSDVNKAESFVRVSAVAEGNTIVISVTDNGIGISAEHLPKIFSMFYRASEKSKGSGLGLFIARETMERLKGTITLQSQLEKGCTFTLRLPQA